MWLGKGLDQDTFGASKLERIERAAIATLKLLLLAAALLGKEGCAVRWPRTKMRAVEKVMKMAVCDTGGNDASNPSFESGSYSGSKPSVFYCTLDVIE
jgi:hypothetical protein